MRAAALNNGRMLVRDDVAEPTPEFGQVLVQVKACGICGSDLHFVHHGADMMHLTSLMEGVPDMGGPELDMTQDIFMGHEFAAEVLDVGPDTVGPASGSLVTSIPILLSMSGIRTLVYNNDLPARVRRTDAPLGGDAGRGAQRPRRQPRGDDRADGRRSACGEPVRDRRT